MTRSRGFTLVEVLVALMIMAVLSTMAWQGIDGIVRARDISQAQLDRSLRLNTVIAQWDQDLAAVQDMATVPALAFDGANLRLVRRWPVARSWWSGRCRARNGGAGPGRWSRASVSCRRAGCAASSCWATSPAC